MGLLDMIKKDIKVLDFITGKPQHTVNLRMGSVVVEHGVGQIRATWTPELAEDIERYHNIDVETELTALLSEQVAAEIDREILNELFTLRDNEPKDFKPKKNILSLKGLINLRKRENQRDIITEKWSSAGLLGVSGEIQTLLDNQNNFFVPEREEIPDYSNLLPVVTRVYPRTVALDIIPIQPMGPPNLEPVIDLSLEPVTNLSGVVWRTDDTWCYDSLYGSKIGIKMNIKTHKFVDNKIPSIFDDLEGRLLEF